MAATPNDRTDRLARLNEAVDKHTPEAIELLSALIKIRSVNPDSPGIDPATYAGGEAECIALLTEAFDEIGAETQLVERATGRPNLIATVRGGGGRSLAFNGHVDTVAPIDLAAWESDPWEPTVRGGEMFGLGATDMKSGLASLWLLAKAHQSTGLEPDGDLQFHFVVAEETMGHKIGTSAVIEEADRVDGVVVVEATSGEDVLNVNHVSAGNWLFTVRVRGKGTHWGNRSRYIRHNGIGNDIGVNAADKLVYVYDALRNLEEEWAFTRRHPEFEPGYFIIHPGVMSADVGFPAVPYFPDRGYIDYLLWFPPGVPAEEIRSEVTDWVATAAKLDLWLRENPPEIDWLDTWPPLAGEISTELTAAALEARNTVAADRGLAEQSKPTSFFACCDASFYEGVEIPAIVLGPGDGRWAHAANERVPLDSIPLASKMYGRLAATWAERP